MKSTLYHLFFSRFSRVWLAWKYAVENEYQNYLYAKEELVPFGDTLRKVQALAPVFVTSVRGKTFLEIGCDTGFFPMQALLAGATRATGVDRNEGALAKARRAAGKVGVGPVEFRHGCIPDIDLDCAADTVLFMSTLHYMFSDKHGNSLLFRDMGDFVRYLAAYVRETLLIEFVGPEDRYAQMLVAEELLRSGAYSEAAFVKALKEQFAAVHCSGQTHYATRKLFICRKA